MTDVATPPAKAGEALKAASVAPTPPEARAAGPRAAPTAAETAQASGPAAAPAKRRMSPVVRVVLLLVAVGVLIAAAVFGLQWWTHGRFVQGTNDAYLRADAVTIAPKVGGYVEQVFVADNQAVKAGDPLAKIDTANYDAVVAQQQASLVAREADVGTAEKQVLQSQAVVVETQTQLLSARVDYAYADGDAKRYDVLAAQGVETARTRDTAHHTRDAANVVVSTRAAALGAAQKQVDTLKAQIAQAQAGVEAQAAALKSAKLNQGDTLLTASIPGRIGDKSVRVGQFVQPGQRLMSVVPTQDVYLVANFKETQIGRMRIGQHATVRIDALGGRKVDAVVDSFSPGTGSQFALLPPENATGNFTKIVQRVPVRLRLNAPEDLRDHLLPGLSAAVSVDTTQAVESRR